MLRKITLALAAASAVLAMNACGDSQGPGAGSTPSTQPSPTEKTASVQQYAGVVNSSMKSMRETWAEYEDKCPLGEEPTNPVLCKLTALSLDIEAQTLVTALDGAAKPGVPAFIGKPPGEIEMLVTDTRAAAQGVMDVIGEAGEVQPGELLGVMVRILGLFDKWEPYI